MGLLIEHQQNGTEVYEELFELVMQKTLEQLGLDRQVEVSLLLTDNEGICRLNHEYRGMNSYTDVLSFPLLELDPFDREAWLKEIDNNLLPGTNEVMLGDIVISMEMAAKQAEEYGHSLERELGFLMVHGLLHILGYDHEQGSEHESVMDELQEEILDKLNLARL